jgi:hypothetical protein
MNLPLPNIEDREAKKNSVWKEIACASLLGFVTIITFSQLFDKENSLSYSIGYNLYGAERVLDGEIPYRDFHTLYPPATLYLNAALFRFFGINLYNALCGVLIFKTLTTLLLYLSARRLMPCLWALTASAFSLFWLRPNGPFKAVPMHYGALFLAVALFYLISKTPDKINLFLAGVALGLLALFKHNIGIYALAGSLIVVLLDENAAGFSLKRLLKNYRRALWLIIGCATPVLPVLVYMQAKGALGHLIRTLLFGPGEFLLNRLAAVPLPFIPAGFVLWLVVCAYAARRLQLRPSLASGVYGLAILSVSGFLLFARQEHVDALIFYAPVLVIAAGLYIALFGRRFELTNQRAVFAVTICAAAAFMEAFPRFAREQAIASMPFIALLLLYILYSLRALLERFTVEKTRYKMALVILPLAVFLMGGRLFVQTFFDSHMQLKSNQSLGIERGRGVLFPAEKAEEINKVVAYLQERVPPNGYFFAQSYAGSSYLFLADRNNPSGAQFWGGVGVKDTERAATLEALQRQQVNLIVTSSRDLAAEKYQPMRDFIEQNFKLNKEFGETLILER